MKTLKIKYTSKEDIPEGLSQFYSEEDGTFRLNVEGVKTQEDVDRAMSAMEKQKQLRIEAERDLAKFKEVDLDRWEKLKDLDPDKTFTGDEKDIQKKISESIREKEKEWQNQSRKREEELEAEKKSLEERFKKHYLDQYKRNMLAQKFGFADIDKLDTFLLKIEHSPLQEYSDLRRLIQSIDVEVENGQFKEVGGELKDSKGALEILERVAKSEPAKAYRVADDTTGGGAGNRKGGDGPTGTNPYKKDSWNLTEQGRLEKDSPQDAKRLAAQAGIPLEIPQ